MLFFALIEPNRTARNDVFTGMCDSVYRRGVCLSAMLGYHTPPGADTLQEQPPPPHPRADTPPPGADKPLGADTNPQSMLGDKVNGRAVRILLECNFVIINDYYVHSKTTTFAKRYSILKSFSRLLALKPKCFHVHY